MNSPFLTGVLSAATWCGAAGAEPANIPGIGLGQRDRLITAFEQLPMARLEGVFMACDQASSARLMAMDEGALCAMAWDALLRRRFEGDVEALLAWWRAERSRRRTTD
jgi:hypothetical protein